MSEFIQKVASSLDDLTGIQGSLGYVLIIIAVLIGHSWMNGGKGAVSASTDRGAESSTRGSASTGPKVPSDAEDDPPRNFTAAQLAYFDGTKDPRTKEDKPVYLAINGKVFDVSEGRGFYGPEGPYELFAGHECGVALAKMSFDTQYLDNIDGCSKLNHGERMELDNWAEKFQYYRCYPVLGRLVPDSKIPPPDRVLTKQELRKYNGTGAIPEGYATPPIYLAAGGKVYDMSFGGVLFYGPGCSYNRFAGKDASRALALMSFDENDIENSSLGDLQDKQKEVLNDWIKTFEERKRYPCVGRLKKG